jgi:D-alanyl-D-alanine carboxypeptidase-like protein
MSESPAPSAAKPAKAPVRWRARLNRAAAALTHTVFVLVIVLAFVRGGEPQATVKEPDRLAQQPAPALTPPTPEPRRTAALPETPQERAGEVPAPQSTPAPQVMPAPDPTEASPEPSESEEFEVAQRSRRSRREPREEPPAPPAQPLPTPQRSADDQARANRLMARLVATYPDLLAGHDDNNLIWRDGERMGFDDGAEKSFQERLEGPDIEDQFAIPYPAGDVLSDPEPDFDPGRFRNAAFFLKMYGDCRRGSEVQKRLVDVIWLPKTGGGRKIKATPVNGVAEKLQRVSDELDTLAPEFQKFLRPIGGTFNCRDILNTSRHSAHAYGIAIDLNTAQGDYWEARSGRRRGEEALVYRNRIPPEIVAIFEKHGFIWGGKWYHFDTAHFEYRPELLVADEEASGGSALVPMPVKQPRNLN